MSVSISSPAILGMAEMATSFSELHQAHACMLKTGLFRSTFAAAQLLHSAGSSSSLHPSHLAYASSLFSRMDVPNSFSWNTMIRAFTTAGEPERALLLFDQMLYSPVFPDRFTFPFVLKACSFLDAVEEAAQIHGRILKAGFGLDIYVSNTLIHVYASGGRINDAFKLFDRMPDRDVVSWNAILSAYVDKGLVVEAQELFQRMPERNVETWNFMMSGYVKTGLVDEARELFDQMPLKDIVSWNALISGFASVGRFIDALQLFQRMQHENVQPDERTLVTVLSACAQVGALGQGEWTHAYIDKNGVEIKGFLATALVDMYSKFGSIEKAKQVFTQTSKKDVSTWNALLEGLSSHGLTEEALYLFEEMKTNGFAPNGVTFVNILSACSHGGFLDAGCQIFDLMIPVYKVEPNVKHYGCMVDLYGRVGLLKEAVELIKRVPVEESLVLLESLLSASQSHGKVEFAEMVAKQLMKLSPHASSCYVQLSNLYSSVGRWEDAGIVREMMRLHGIRKEPGCSTIEVDGAIHEFFAGD